MRLTHRERSHCCKWALQTPLPLLGFLLLQLIYAQPTHAQHNWHTRSTSEQAVDSYPRHLLSHKINTYQKDLPGLITEDVIRIGLLNQQADFRIINGRAMGLGQSIGQQIGKHLKLRVEFVLAADANELFSHLSRGQTDFALRSECLDSQITPNIHEARLSVRREPICWLHLTNRPILQSFLYRFLTKHKKSGLLANLILKNRTQLKSLKQPGPNRPYQLTNYDRDFKRVGEQFGLDWRLLAAIGYQESRLHHDAQSPHGAEGLMQMLPETAKRFGVEDTQNPRQSIQGATRYLKYALRRFAAPDISFRNRIRFALASYNAGLGHVYDARRLAKQIGLDENKWFGHVEKAMRLLQEKRYFKYARHGRARGSEVVQYVSEIQSRYDNYVMFLSTQSPKHAVAQLE